MSAPQIGDTNVRGYILPATTGYEIEALESIYGQQQPGVFNPLLFNVIGGVNLPVATEVLFDVIAGPWSTAIATNVRRA